MDAYPLLFTFQDMVSGKGFVAGVIAKGRGICELEEDGKWWFYGVEPGGVADSGDSPGAALFNFRNTFRSVLFDLAEGSDNFEAFSATVQSFFHEVDEVDGQRWRESAEALRSKKSSAGPFKKLKRRPFEEAVFVKIVRLDQTCQPPAVHNTLDSIETAA